MTQHIVATAPARGRINTAVLFLRLHQRRRNDHQARRQQLLADDPHVHAERLRRRAATLADKVDRTRAGVDLGILASRIEVRIEFGETSTGRPTHEARFVCRCGWTTRSAAPGTGLMIPNRVRDHERVCEYAHPDQGVLEDLMRDSA